MTLLGVLSALCMGIGVLLGLPQAIRLLRTRSSAGLSVLAWQVWTAVSASWFLHGMLLPSVTQMVPNGVGLLECVAILLLARRDRGLTWRGTFGVALLVTLLAAAVRVWLGPMAFATFMVVPQAGAVLAQFVDLVRCRDLTGVSPVYLALVVVLQASWIGYGRLLPDPAAAAVSTVMIVLAGLNLLWWVLRRAGLRPLWPTADPDVTDSITAPGAR